MESVSQRERPVVGGVFVAGDEVFGVESFGHDAAEELRALGFQMSGSVSRLTLEQTTIGQPARHREARVPADEDER